MFITSIVRLKDCIHMNFCSDYLTEMLNSGVLRNLNEIAVVVGVIVIIIAI